MKDKHGRPYLKFTDGRKGLRIVCDGDFTCVKPWSYHRLERDEGYLTKYFFRCSCIGGKHYIDEQNLVMEPSTNPQIEYSYYLGIYKAGTFKQRKDDHG